MTQATAHAYIEKRAGHRGGRAIVKGTSFPVSSVVTYVLRHGLLPEELVGKFPHLTLAQVYDALSYYYDHKDEIDAEVEANLSQDAGAARLPQDEILRFRYDSGTGQFSVQSLGEFKTADPE